MLDYYRAKNTDLLNVVEKITSYINQGMDASVYATELCEIIDHLSTEIDSHKIDEENRSAYLKMLNSPDHFKSKLTETYIREMGKLNYILKNYVNTYSNDTAIRKNADEFTMTTKHVAAFLQEKVNNDNTGFYEMMSQKH